VTRAFFSARATMSQPITPCGVSRSHDHAATALSPADPCTHKAPHSDHTQAPQKAIPSLVTSRGKSGTQGSRKGETGENKQSKHHEQQTTTQVGRHSRRQKGSHPKKIGGGALQEVFLGNLPVQYRHLLLTSGILSG